MSQRVERQCRACGVRFQTFVAWLRDGGGGLFCGRECQSKGKAKRSITMIQATCEICSKPFARRKGASGTMRFCSMKCMGAGRKRDYSGSNHPRWKGGLTRDPGVTAIQKKRVRDVGQCERCGSRDHLQGHHREHYALSPGKRTDPQNIEVLCANCHADEHPHMAAMLLYPRPPQVEIHCIRCGATKLLCRSKAKVAKYCSHRCQMLARNGR